MGYLFTADSNGKISKYELDKKTKVIKNDDGTVDLKFSTLQKIKNSFKSGSNILAKGVTKETESQLDWLNKANAKVTSTAYKLLGRNDLADQKIQNTNNFIEEDLTQNLWNKTGAQKSLESNVTNGSIIKEDNLGGQILYGIGQQGVRIAEGALLTGGSNLGKVDGLDNLNKYQKIGVQLALDSPSNIAMYASSYGSGYEQALQMGATTKQAEKYAKGSAAIEFATEMITGGIPGTNGKGFLDYGAEKAINKLTQKASSKVANIALKYGYHIMGEGFEEAMSEILNPYLKNATYSSNEKVDWEQVWNAAVVGGVIGGILEAPGTINELRYNKTNRGNLPQNTKHNKNKLNVVNENNSEEKINISNNNERIEQIQNRIQKLEQLQANNNITSTQEQYLERLKKQLNDIQNQNTKINLSLPSKSSKEILHTVQDIVNQGKISNSNINLPVDNQLNNATNSNINSSKAILPTANDFKNSNVNIPTSNIKVDMTKIKPEILEDIKGFKQGDPNIESYKGSYIKTMMNEVGIKVPAAMNYVSEVRPDMSFTTTKDLTRQQYASIGNALQKLRSVDVTGVNNTNNAMLPVTSDINSANINMPIDMSQIKQTKGNIPINQELLNKYSTAKEIFDNEINNFDGKVNIETNLSELNDIDISSLKSKETKELAYAIFKKYNSKSVFENDGNKITVSKSGINESVEKIFNNKEQRNLLKEHLQVFSDLGDIIEHATLVNQTREVKNRENINSWNYYFDGLNIDGEIYHLEFDVRSLHNGQNQYRVQRLQKKQTTHSGDLSNITNDLPAFGQSAFSENNIPQSNINVKSDILPTINDMQNNKNNTNNLAPTKEYFEGKDINEQPEKLAQILKEKTMLENDKEGWLKKLATIKFIDKGYYVDKLARKTKNSELSSKYDYSLTANGIANHIIGNGRYDEKGNKIGKGLYEIFEPIENSGLLDDFSNYIYHKHNIDRMNLQNRYNEVNKAVFGDSMTSEMSEQKVKEYESKYPEFETWANDIYEYNNANLEMLVKYGILSNEDKDYYNKKYPHYVPTIRQNSKIKTQMDFLLGKKASVNNPIKTARGGNGDIIPLKDAMALRTMQTVNSSLRNNFGLELLNTIETEQIRNKENVDNIVEDINMEELITKSDKTKPATLTVFDNGEKITFDISDEIYEALKPSNIYTVKWLNKINNFRRGLLTEYNPTFMITNPIKDIQDGSINSKHPKTFAKNLIEATKQIKNKGQYYQLYMANGGSYETYFNYNTGTNIVPSKIDKISPLKKISEINEVIEMTPRLAEFISSIEAGDSIETAMYNANEITTNFKRGGDITKTLDRNGVTFLNAGVQGTVKQIRNIQEARVEGIKGITKLAVRWTIAGLIPMLLMNMIWGDDEDYEELSDYVKNNYYIVGKYDDGKFIRIPKGRVISVLQSFFQNMINGVNGEELDLDGFIDLIENNLLPNNPEENNLLSPLVQAHNNITWYGGTLVPTRLQNLPNAEQYDESIDSISIWLGKQLNISPYKINYVLDQYSGAIGDYILPYLTQEAESGNDSFTGKLIAPVKDKFIVDSTLKNQNISDFYSLSEELAKKSNSSKATDEDILKNKYINSIKSEISKLYSEKREIQNSSLKDSEKYNQSKEIQKEINELSKNALKNYNDVELYDNYAIVNDREYYKNNNDEWAKIDTNSTKYKTVNLITKYNSYLKYDNEIKNIKKQYSNSNARKNAVIKYVNSLNLTIPQKAMLIKMSYSSYTNYDNQVINYINSQNITVSEKEEILENLGFKIRNGKVYSK